MLTLINHITAFWTVVVLNCIHPVNFQYCYKDVDKWLFPEVMYGFQLYTGQIKPYENERIK
tara:strand:- start:9251 stop:9433 length:183 start_codon:yes stop_codon:yes gene_type:complete